MTNLRSSQIVADNKENRVMYSPFVIFTNDTGVLVDKNLLDLYLKIKLNNFDVNRNPTSWQNAKEELGRKLFKNDELLKELRFYRRWFNSSVLLNIALGVLVFRLANRE